MVYRPSFGERLFDIVVYGILLVLVVITLYPLLHVLFASFSEANRIISHEGILLRPLGFNLAAYEAVFKNPAIATGYVNTAFIVVAGVCVNLFLTSLGAYVLSRRGVLWNKYFMFIIVFTMFFSGGLIPTYLVVKGLGLIDSLWALIIPFAVGTFHLIIMRTAFQQIPEALEESAKIDGANHFVIFARIVLPLSLPVLAVIGLYIAVDKWNGWLYASIYLRDRALYPLQLILRDILISSSVDVSGAATGDEYQIAQTIKYATIMVATVPILCVYPFLQKYFVKGALIGALKG